MDMDFKEFWDESCEKDALEYADTIIEVFNKPFADEIYKEYDVGDLLCEFADCHETANQYEKIEVFGEAVKQNHPKLYKKDGDYINNPLIQYYCFKDERDKLKIQFHDFVSREYHYDLLLNSIDLTLYYQHTELLNQIIDKIYNDVKNSPKLVQGAEYDLDYMKYHIELEQLYINEKNKANIDFSNFTTTLNDYNFEIENKHLNLIEIALFNDSTLPLKQLLKDLKIKKMQLQDALIFRFLRFMYLKNCHFGVSYVIWYNHQNYFEEIDIKKFENFFIKKDSFVKFLNSKNGFLMDKGPDLALILWGSHYINEFAYEEQLISEKKYRDQIEIIKDIKKDFKQQNKYYLWNYSFVHKWLPCACYSAEEWAAEKETFIASYDLTVVHEPIPAGNLDDYLDEASLESFQDSDESWDQEKVPEREYEIISSDEPYISEEKIGRNVKVDVLYTDGTVKEGVKFKKVMQDIENGACEITDMEG